MANMKSNHCISVISIIYTWNFSDPCFEMENGRKQQHSLGGFFGLKPQNRVPSRFVRGTSPVPSSLRFAPPKMV